MVRALHAKVETSQSQDHIRTTIASANDLRAKWLRWLQTIRHRPLSVVSIERLESIWQDEVIVPLGVNAGDLKWLSVADFSQVA